MEFNRARVMSNLSFTLCDIAHNCDTLAQVKTRFLQHIAPIEHDVIVNWFKYTSANDFYSFLLDAQAQEQRTGCRFNLPLYPDRPQKVA